MLNARVAVALLMSVMFTQVNVPAPLGGVVAIRQPIEPDRWLALPFGLLTVTAALIVPPALALVLEPLSTVAAVIDAAATTYGPT